MAPPDEPLARCLVSAPEASSNSFELLPEGGYAPTGVFRSQVKVDRPFAIDFDLPDVTW